MRRWTAVQCRAKRRILEAPSTRGPGRRLRATDAGQLRATIQHHRNAVPPILWSRHAHSAWPPKAPMTSIILSPAEEMAIPNPGPYSPVSIMSFFYARRAEIQRKATLSRLRGLRDQSKMSLGIPGGFPGLHVIHYDYFLKVELFPPRSFLNFRTPLGASKDLV